MTTAAPCLNRPIPLHRPLAARWLDRLVEAWQALRPNERRTSAPVEEWDLDQVAALNDATLRDIGVPEWLVAEAHVRRGADHRALLEVHAAMNGLFIRSV
jgi:hypothetical protein